MEAEEEASGERGGFMDEGTGVTRQPLCFHVLLLYVTYMFMWEGVCVREIFAQS